VEKVPETGYVSGPQVKRWFSKLDGFSLIGMGEMCRSELMEQVIDTEAGCKEVYERVMGSNGGFDDDDDYIHLGKTFHLFYSIQSSAYPTGCHWQQNQYGVDVIFNGSTGTDTDLAPLPSQEGKIYEKICRKECTDSIVLTSDTARCMCGGNEMWHRYLDEDERSRLTWKGKDGPICEETEFCNGSKCVPECTTHAQCDKKYGSYAYVCSKEEQRCIPTPRGFKSNVNNQGCFRGRIPWFYKTIHRSVGPWTADRLKMALEVEEGIDLEDFGDDIVKLCMGVCHTLRDCESWVVVPEVVPESSDKKTEKMCYALRAKYTRSSFYIYKPETFSGIKRLGYWDEPHLSEETCGDQPRPVNLGPMPNRNELGYCKGSCDNTSDSSTTWCKTYQSIRSWQPCSATPECPFFQSREECQATDKRKTHCQWNRSRCVAICGAIKRKSECALTMFNTELKCSLEEEDRDFGSNWACVYP
jgi:hypothetical protein